MKNVVDPSGWLAYFADENGADFFAPAIEDLENPIPNFDPIRGDFRRSPRFYPFFSR